MKTRHPNPNKQKEDDKAARRLDQFESMRQPSDSKKKVSGNKGTPQANNGDEDRSKADDPGN
jgi:hypothetical protein